MSGRAGFPNACCRLTEYLRSFRLFLSFRKETRRPITAIRWMRSFLFPEQAERKSQSAEAARRREKDSRKAPMRAGWQWAEQFRLYDSDGTFVGLYGWAGRAARPVKMFYDGPQGTVTGCARREKGIWRTEFWNM